MDEQGARDWLGQHCDVSRETLERLDRFVDFLSQENKQQNLVAESSLESVWERHIVDSAQLFNLGKGPDRWLDLGSGAGFPGLVLAVLGGSVTLVEERRLRSDFLARAADVLEVSDRVEIVRGRVETFQAPPFATISARAFAPLDRLFNVAAHLAAPETRWVLPKGRNAKSELEAAQASWQGEFRLEPSITDADAMIIVAERVQRKSKGKQAR
ncbi:16S rRNA (guanine(527)-N(7))-methyltransferase RsmG [Sphingomonas sp.]|uniref:16S rRNA (guanine(527)-N(7))-methyltransferase RsmG n=1 Tax=Sphingomonas sp. TaxID=28214 RepID=UPI002FC6E362